MYPLAKFRQFPLVVSAQRPIAYQKAVAKQKCRHAHLRSKGELRRQPNQPFGKSASETIPARIVAGNVPREIAAIGSGRGAWYAFRKKTGSTGWYACSQRGQGFLTSTCTHPQHAWRRSAVARRPLRCTTAAEIESAQRAFSLDTSSEQSATVIWFRSANGVH